MHSRVTTIATSRTLIAFLGFVCSACDAAGPDLSVPGAKEAVVESLIDEIRRDTFATRQYTGRSALSERVVEAMRTVPREAFVPLNSVDYAYENRPLTIGYGQTISQPFIVALMTELLETRASHRILEIGTGSGYQAAVLSSLVEHVYTIEIIPELAAIAEARLQDLEFNNISVKTGDGWHGWPQVAPFDGIIVTAVAPEVPPKLLTQLKPGGLMVIPIGPQRGAQNLVVIEKTEDGFAQHEGLPVQFVPLTRLPE